MSATKEFINQQKRKQLEKLVVEAEWRRCQRDKRYAYENYFYIPSAENQLGRALFKLWDFQEDTQSALDTSDRLVIAKTRQIGMTTQTMCDSFHNGFFNQGRYELLVVSKSQEDAKTNLSMLDHLWRFLPEWMKRRGPERIDTSTEQITFRHRDNGLFRSVSIVGTPKRGAGKTANRVVLDEYGLMDKPSQIYKALEPTTLAALRSDHRRGAVFVILSTPRGGRNAFARQWIGAHKGEAARWTAMYHPVTCNRFLGPPGSGEAAGRVERAKAARLTPDPADLPLAGEFWAAWKAMQNDPAYKEEPWNFFSEYSRTWEEAFRESGRSRFQHVPPADDCPPLPYAGWFKTVDGKVEIDMAEDDESALAAPWQFAYLPEEWPRDVQIVVGADPATGVLGDYSAAAVLAAAKGPDGEDAAEVLAAYWNNAVTPSEFADELNRAGRFFKPSGSTAATMAVERPPGGAGDGEVIARLKSLRYPQHCIFRYTALDRVSDRKRAVYGWPTDKATKPEAIRALARLLTQRFGEDGEPENVCLLLNLFPEARDQLVSYVVLNQPGDTGYERLGADAGGHDDLVMALAIGAAVLERTRGKGNKPRTVEPSGEAPVLPDGPITRWNPGRYLEREKEAARKRQETEANEWQRQLYDKERTEALWQRLR
jgi:hypothetical protein